MIEQFYDKNEEPPAGHISPSSKRRAGWLYSLADKLKKQAVGEQSTSLDWEFPEKTNGTSLEWEPEENEKTDHITMEVVEYLTGYINEIKTRFEPFITPDIKDLINRLIAGIPMNSPDIKMAYENLLRNGGDLNIIGQALKSKNKFWGGSVLFHSLITDDNLKNMYNTIKESYNSVAEKKDQSNAVEEKQKVDHTGALKLKNDLFYFLNTDVTKLLNKLKEIATFKIGGKPALNIQIVSQLDLVDLETTIMTLINIVSSIKFSSKIEEMTTYGLDKLNMKKEAKAIDIFNWLRGQTISTAREGNESKQSNILGTLLTISFALINSYDKKYVETRAGIEAAGFSNEVDIINYMDAIKDRFNTISNILSERFPGHRGNADQFYIKDSSLFSQHGGKTYRYIPDSNRGLLIPQEMESPVSSGIDSLLQNPQPQAPDAIYWGIENNLGRLMVNPGIDMSKVNHLRSLVDNIAKIVQEKEGVRK